MLLVTGSEQENSDKAFLAKSSEDDKLDTTNPRGNDRPTDISSVITQVTTRDPAPFRPAAAFRSVTQPHQTWKSKVRSLLCCFAPQNNGYVKSTDGDAPGSRILGLPPLPPKHVTEAIIGPIRQEDVHKKTLVLDLDETLVHSSFKPIPNPDYIIPVEIDGKLVDVYVLKRPWLDHFMESVGQRFEVVIFTASLSKYADPLLDLLDKANVVRWRLFRESCFPYEGNYVKDLNCLGRDLAHTIIVDNSPHSYVFQPMNALPIGTFIDNMEDQELLEMIPLLQKMDEAEDVRVLLSQYCRT